MSENKKYELTAEELAAEELDNLIMGVAKSVNDSNGSSDPYSSPGDIHPSELEYWATLGNIGKVKIELNSGADVNATSELKCTPLHLAAANGHFEVVKMLVESGANIHAKLESGQTPIDLAEKYPEIVEYLQSLQ